MRQVVLLTRIAAEADRNGQEVAFTRMAVLHRLVQHMQADAFENLWYAGFQVRARVAHGGDLEFARKLETLAFLLRGDVAQVFHGEPPFGSKIAGRGENPNIVMLIKMAMLGFAPQPTSFGMLISCRYRGTTTG